MRIVCPSCAATYEIADGMLVKPRTVRCSRCAREWVQDPIPKADSAAAAELSPALQEVSGQGAEALANRPADPIPAPPPPPAPAMVPAQPVPAGRLPSPAPRTGLTLAWIGSILLLAALAFAAYRYRVEIQQAWPPSARLFRLLPN